MSSTVTKNNQAPQKRIFLEIGPDAYPTAAHTTKRYTGGDVYVAVENKAGDYKSDKLFEGHDSMFKAQRRFVGARALEENVILTEGDGRNLQFPDKSVHEVFMGNVLNGVDSSDIPAFLSEAHRVMDGSGPLVIDMENGVGSGFVSDIQDELEAAGFDEGRVVERDGVEADEWQQLNGEWPSAMWPEDHTFLIAHKLPDTSSSS